MSTPQSWSRGGRRQADEVRWGQKVTKMGWGTDKDEKGKKGGRTMTGTRLRRLWAFCNLIRDVGVDVLLLCGEVELDSSWGDDLHDSKAASSFVVELLHWAVRVGMLEA